MRAPDSNPEDEQAQTVNHLGARLEHKVHRAGSFGQWLIGPDMEPPGAVGVADETPQTRVPDLLQKPADFGQSSLIRSHRPPPL
jgi:hypothetical protein